MGDGGIPALAYGRKLGGYAEGDFEVTTATLDADTLFTIELKAKKAVIVKITASYLFKNVSKMNRIPAKTPIIIQMLAIGSCPNRRHNAAIAKHAIAKTNIAIMILSIKTSGTRIRLFLKKS
jgi:hypothetical protein